MRELLKSRNGTLEVPDEIRSMILKNGNSAEFGARLYRREVEHLIEDPLADAILLATPKGPFRAVGKLSEDGKSVVFQIEPSDA